MRRVVVAGASSRLFDAALGRHAWHARRSQTYPELNRLAGEGLVTVVGEGPRGRRTYDLTETGRAELRDWVREHAGDHRGASIALTDAGRRVIEAAAPAHLRSVRGHFIDLLTREQLITLAEISDVVLAHLADPAPPDTTTRPPRT